MNNPPSQRARELAENIHGVAMGWRRGCVNEIATLIQQAFNEELVVKDARIAELEVEVSNLEHSLQYPRD